MLRIRWLCREKPGRFFRAPALMSPANTGRGQQMKQHHAKNPALFPCEFVS
jgi:hypothetical protein